MCALNIGALKTQSDNKEGKETQLQLAVGATLSDTNQTNPQPYESPAHQRAIWLIVYTDVYRLFHPTRAK